MASPYSRSTRDGLVPDYPNQNRGLRDTRGTNLRDTQGDNLRDTQGTNLRNTRGGSPLRATQNDNSYDLGFDWLDEPKRDYNWESSRRDEDYRRSRVVGWNSVGDTLRNEEGQIRRDPYGRTIKENLGGPSGRRVDLGATGHTRVEEHELARSRRYGDDDSPYIVNQYDRPGATRRVPVTDSSVPSSYQPYVSRHTKDMRDSHSIEHTLPNYDNINKRHGGGNEGSYRMDRTWKSMAADRQLMGDWHYMFNKIRTKWTGNSGYDDPTKRSDGSSSVDSNSSYSKRDSAISGRCKALILGILVLILLAMVATILYFLLVPKTEPDDTVYDSFKMSSTITNLNYTDALADPNSEEYLALEKQFCGEIDKHSNTTSGYEGCKVESFKNGSIIVEFTVVFKSSPGKSPITESQVISIIFEINVQTNETTLGSFTITTVVTIEQTRQVQGKPPLPSTVAINGTCGNANTQRCQTTRSRCMNNVCSCSSDKIYVPSDDSCNPIECSEVAVITNGQIRKNNGTKYGAVLQIECNTGYTWPTANDIMCVKPGSWKDLPDCTPVVCENFTVPDNANIMDANTTGRVYTDTIDITCNPGYDIDGPDSVTCQADKTWTTSPSCTPVEPLGCDVYVANDANIVILSNDSSSIHLACKEGYTLEGNDMVICENGNWSESPSCSQIDCGVISEIQNGSINETSGTNYNDFVVFMCDEGFAMIGESNVSCQTDGAWETLPQCEPCAEDFQTPPNAVVVNKTISCNEGYELVGESVVVCQSNGSWSDFGECIPVSCGNFEAPDNAISNHNPDLNFTYGEIFNVTCITGYTLAGDSEVQCLSDGLWSNLPTCELVVCDDLLISEQHDVGTEATTGRVFNDTIGVTCKPGYEAVGPNTITCLANTTWSTLPECTPVECEAFVVPENSNITNAITTGRVYNDTIDITCDPGYNTDGPESVTCQADTTWTISPVCSPVECEAFVVPDNANIMNANTTGRVYNDIIDITCDPGYNIDGPNSVTCQEDMTWTTSPSCTPVECEAFVVPDNANIMNANTTGRVYNDIIDITCDPGYNIDGPNSVTCQEDTTWTISPSCTPVECEAFVVPDNANIMNANTTGRVYNDTIDITCDPGYDIDGPDSVTCQADTKWSTSPSCTPVDCGEVTVTNGYTENSTGLTFNSTVDIGCDDGYELSEGNPTMRCLANATWGPIVTCSPVVCDPFESTDNTLKNVADNTTVHTFGSVLPIECKDGLTFADGSATSELTCNASAQWAGEQSCGIQGSIAFDMAEYTWTKGENYTMTCSVSNYQPSQIVTVSKLDEQDTPVPVYTARSGTDSEPGTVIAGTSIGHKLENDVLSVEMKFTTIVPEHCGVYLCQVSVSEGDSLLDSKKSNTSVQVMGYDNPGINVPQMSVTVGEDVAVECMGYSESPLSNDEMYLEMKFEGESSFTTVGDVPTTESNFAGCQYMTKNSHTITTDASSESFSVRCALNTGAEVTYSEEVNVTVEPLGCDVYATNDENIVILSNDSSSINLTCKEGYTLEGNDMVICENGNWSESPTCNQINCGDISGLPNGLVNETSGTNYNDFAVFMCDEGFAMIGESNVSCQIDGSWENFPQCEPCAEDFQTPPNAVVVNKTISCNEGYELVGESSIVCLSNGNWSEFGECVPVSCVSFSIPDNSYSDADTNLNFTFGDNVTITCDTGFRLIGDSSVQCLSNGSWSTPPTCEIVFCGPYNDVVMYGNVLNSTGNNYNDTVTIECDDLSIHSVSCLEDGTWENAPGCAQVTCGPFEVENGQTNLTIVDSNSTFPMSTVAEVTCNEGYDASDNTVTTECMENGNWSTDISCSPILCDEFNAVDGTLEIVGGTIAKEYGTNLTIDCKDGLTFEDGSVTRNLTCNLTGGWPEWPSCGIQGDAVFEQDVYSLTKDEVGTIICNVINYANMQNVVIAKLNETGHSIPLYRFNKSNTGDISTQTMTDEMEFSDSEQGSNISIQATFLSVGNDSCGTYACGIVAYEQPKFSYTNVTVSGYGGPEINVQEMTVTAGDNVIVECSGYSNTDLSSDEIYIESQYEGDSMFYAVIDTPVFLSEDIGCQFMTTTYHTIPTNSSTGNFSVRCVISKNGVIDKTQVVNVTVLPIECNEYTTNTNDEHLLISSNNGASIELTCQDGYNLEGNDTVICENGNWSESPTCTIIECETIPEITNGIVNEASDTNLTFTFGDNVTLTCDTGFELVGDSVVECLSNGSWSTPPVCNLVSCDPYNETVMYGNVLIPTGNNYNGSVTIECDDLSIYTVNCLENGTWESAPECVQVTCGPFEVENGQTNLTFVDSNSTFPMSTVAAVTCDDGYDVNDNILTTECMANGNWSTAISCSPILCDEFSAYDTLQDVVTIDREYGTNLTIDCKDGLTFEDGSISRNITCNSTGGWPEVPSCGIQGDAVFEQDVYSLMLGEEGTLICNVTNYANMQNVVIAKLNDTGHPIPLYRFYQNNTGDITDETMTEEMTFSYSEQGSDISVQATFPTVGNDTCGTYACGIVAYEQPKFSYTNVTVSGYGGPEINVQEMTVTAGDNVIVECSGYSNTGLSSDEIYIESQYEGDSMFYAVIDTPVFLSEDIGCQFMTTTSHAIPTNSSTGIFSVRCVISKNGVIDKTQVVNVTVLPIECNEYTTNTNDEHLLISSNNGASIELTCQDGYNLEGNDTVICENGNWSESPTCTIIECETVPEITNGMVNEASDTNLTFTFGDNVTVTCDTGFELVGDSVIECLGNGSWSTPPTCEIVSCGPYNDVVMYGNVLNSTGNNYNDSVTIECDDLSIYTVNCLENGTWESAPECVQVTCDLFEVESGQTNLTIVDSNSTFPMSTVAAVTCDDGYDINDNILTTECMANGNWSTAISCSPILCDEFSTYDTLQDVNTIDREYGTNLTIDCKDGLTFEDGSISRNITCNSTGGWSEVPSCGIQGDAVFEQDVYSLMLGEEGTLICNVTNYANMQNVVIAKINDTGHPIPLYRFYKNNTGDIATEKMTEEMTFSYTEQGSDIFVQATFFPSVGNDSCGTYACGIAAYEQPKFSYTNVTVSDARSPDISVSTDSVDIGGQLEARCTGYLDRHMSDNELFLEIRSESNDTYSRIESATSDYEAEGCQHSTIKSYTIPTTDLKEPVYVRCGIDWNGVQTYSDDTFINVTVGANVMFQNDSYLFFVGQSDIVVCDFYGESVSYVEVYNEDKTSIVNITSDGATSESGMFTVSPDQTFFQETHTRVAVNVDIANCSAIVNDIYTCDVKYKNLNSITDVAEVTIRKSAKVTEFVRSVEIVEGKDTTLEKLFSCTGQLGVPAGEMEIQIKRNGDGKYETFLSNATEAEADTAEGWILDVTQTDSECEDEQHMTFALKSVTKALHLNSLRCAIKPPDDKSSMAVSRPSVLKVVDGSLCDAYSSYDVIPHPYYCWTGVVCNNNAVTGVPFGCSSTGECFDHTTEQCVGCSSFGCVDQPIVCDLTTISANEGDDVEFACNTVDIEGPVTALSLDGEIVTFGELPDEVVVSDSSKMTITDTTTVFSLRNVSCADNKTYELLFNNQWTVQLTLGVETDAEAPFVYLPDVSNANEAMVITCNGSIGRNSDGSAKGSIQLAVEDSISGTFVVYNDAEVSRSTETTDCTLTETATFTIIPDIETWNGTYVRCETQDGSIGYDSEPQQIILGVPDLFCNPVSASPTFDEEVSFTCDLQDTSDVTHIGVLFVDTESNEVTLINETVDNLLWTFSGTNLEAGVQDNTRFSLTFPSATCDQEGEYTININEALSAVVSLAVVSQSGTPTVYVQEGTRVNQLLKINCTAELGRDEDGNQMSELFLEVQSENDFTVYSNEVYTSVDSSNCKHTGLVELELYPDSTWNNSLVRCVTRNGNTTYNISSEETIILQPAAEAEVMFQNDSYLFHIGQIDIVVCDFYGENVSYVEVYNQDKTNLVRVTKANTELQSGIFTVSDPETSFNDTQTRVAVKVDLADCAAIGNDTYTCEVMYQGSSKITAEASVTIRKSPEVTDFVRSVEIVEGKDTTAEKIFSCTGQLGVPAGEMEIQIDRNGDGVYATFLSNANDTQADTSEGWITGVTDVTPTDSKCGIEQHMKFALKLVSKTLHLANLRCAIKPTDDKTSMAVSRPSVLKVVDGSLCDAYSSYDVIPHPYYCWTGVACNNNEVTGVPFGCLSSSTGECFDYNTEQCVECSSFGCVDQPIDCDLTTIYANEGDDVELTCNTVDIEGPVTALSVDGETVTFGELPDAVVVSDSSKMTITDTNTVFSLKNVSCVDDKTYELIFNNLWTVQLTVNIETNPEEPLIYLPESLNANEAMVITCNGSVGRNSDDSAKGSIQLAVEDSSSGTFVVNNDVEVVRTTEQAECTVIETATFTIVPDLTWNATNVRCETQDGTIKYNSESKQILLGVPDLFCNPVSAKPALYDGVSFTCNLQDTSVVTHIGVLFVDSEASEVMLVNETINGLPWTHTGANIDAALDDTSELTLSLPNATCDQEGDYTVNINDALSAVVSVAIVSQPGTPTLYVQEGTRVNQLLKINCTAELGRDEDGNKMSELFLEVQFENEAEFTVYSDEVQLKNDSSNCKHTGVLELLLYPDSSWNNSAIRCVTRSGDTSVTISSEEQLVLEPSSITFVTSDDAGIGIVGEDMTFICIADGMAGLTGLIITRDDDPTDITGDGSVTIVNNDINEDLANLTITKTIKCGDNGIYYCRTEGTSVVSQAQTTLKVQWKSQVPIINLSEDIIANNSPAWAGYETTCTAELGSNNATIFIQSNRNGYFENLTEVDNVQYPIINYDGSSCTNVKTIAFSTVYTADWNQTQFRCIVQDADSQYMDAEVIYVVPENFCSSQSTDVKRHPFDCRSNITCNGDSKMIPNKICKEADSCYNLDANVCVDCEAFGQCREDPLDVEPYMECSAPTGTIGGTASVGCSLYFIDGISASVSLSLDGTTIIDSASNTGTSPIDGSLSPTMTPQSSTITVTFDPVVCADKGQYVVELDNGTNVISDTFQFNVQNAASEPILTKSLDAYYSGVEMTLSCTGPVGDPVGSLELMYRSDSTGTFTPINEPMTSSYDEGNCTYVGQLDYTFVVGAASAGNEYMCRSTDYTGQTYDSTIESVTVATPPISFLKEQVTAEIGSSYTVTCNVDNDSGGDGVNMTLTLADETINNICSIELPFTNDSVTCESGYSAVVVENSADWSLVVTGSSATCSREGTLHCYSRSSSDTKASSQLHVTRQNSVPTMPVPAVTIIGPYGTPDKLICTADLGYPATDRVLKIQKKSNGESSFGDLTEITASGQCVDEETVLEQRSFTTADDGAEVRCVVFDTNTNQVFNESTPETLFVVESGCPTNASDYGVTGYVYLTHPLYCNSYISCYGSGQHNTPDCSGSGCFNEADIIESVVCSESHCGQCVLPLKP